MNKPHNTASQQPFYAMQLRCGERKLLLPRNCIAEIRAFAEPEPLAHPNSHQLINAPAWIIGSLKHLNLTLPVISLEMLIDGADDFERRRTRICIMHAVSTALNPPSYALLCQGFPSLLEVPTALTGASQEEPAADTVDAENPYIAAHMQFAAYLAAIPNLPEIESALANVLNDANNH